MWIIIFIMILAVLLIVCFETWNRIKKKKDLEAQKKQCVHTKNLLEIEKAKLDLEKKKLAEHTEFEKRK